MFNIFNMRKSASSKDIIMDFAKAWQTLNTKLIENICHPILFMTPNGCLNP